MFRRVLPLLLCVLITGFVPSAPLPRVQALPLVLARSAPSLPPAAPAGPPVSVRTAPKPNITPASIPAHAQTPPTQLGRATLPLAFMPNRGQHDSHVRFQIQGLGGSIFFTPTEVVFTLPTSRTTRLDPAGLPSPQPPDLNVVRLHFEGAASQPTITTTERLPGTVNIIRGNDPAEWRTNLPTYAGINYTNLYPGIDLRYDGEGGQLKSTYTIAPGVDPSSIRWRYIGTKDIQIDPAGNLVLTLPETPHALKDTATLTRTLIEQAPVAWQTIDGRHVSVSVRYTLEVNRRVGFALGAYDPTLPLTIDPALAYSTYLGGGGFDEVDAITVDASGNAYVTGETQSSDFPVVQPAQNVFGGHRDAFVAKLNPQSTALLYSTYLGGSQGDGGLGIAVDSDGAAYVTGWAMTNFPSTQSPPPTINNLASFVTKLTPSGAIDYSTILDPAHNNAGLGIAVNTSDEAIITGWTESQYFPTTSGAIDSTYDGDKDAYVVKLSNNGSTLLYSTFLGGTRWDVGYAVALDSSGNAYVSGNTASTVFTSVSAPGYDHTCSSDCSYGLKDAFVVKLDFVHNVLAYYTYLGGVGEEESWDIALDASGAAYIAG